jgi:hypothetical protein
MKLKDVIDIDGKLYQIIYVGDGGSFEAEPIGEVVAKGFTRPQDDSEIVRELDDFCDCQQFCKNCCLDGYLDCNFGDYSDKQLAEAYRIMKENM